MNIKQQKGLSLVELMIAMAIGTLLTAALVELFINNKASYNIQDGLSRMQENGRFAEHLLNNEIRMAGYQGCPNLNRVAPNVLVASPPSNVTFTNATTLSGYEATSSSAWSPSLPTGVSGNVVGGTDVIVVRKASQTYTQLNSNMTTADANISVQNRLTIIPGNVLFITDCESSDIFKASTGTNNTNIVHNAGTDNTTTSLSKAYQTDAKISPFEVYYYYVKNTGRTNSTGLPILSLYRRDMNNNEQELVEGVENMQITYGLDTDNDGAADTFANAQTINAASNWPQVVSINVSLLLNSVDEVNPQQQAYAFQGTTTTPANRLLHRQWDLYITLRNHSL